MTAPESPCPDCGNDPNDDSLHAMGCVRIDTCGQFGPPWIDPPWHELPDPFRGWDNAGHVHELHA